MAGFNERIQSWRGGEESTEYSTFLASQTRIFLLLIASFRSFLQRLGCLFMAGFSTENPAH